MKTLLRVTSLCLLLVLIMTVLAACGPTRQEVAGTYEGSYAYNGYFHSYTIDLYKDGTYRKAYYRNGLIYSVDRGDYDINGNKITLHIDEYTSTVYNYSDGQLENGGHIFTKNK